MSLLKKLSLPLLLVLVLVTLFFIVQPRTQQMLFAYKRQAELTTLIQQTKEQNHLDLALYWQFREFYSPGFFEYEKTGFDTRKDLIVASFKQRDKHAIPQLFFTSKRITSIGGQTTIKNLPVKPNANEKIIASSSSVIVTEDQKYITVLFLEPVSEVKKVNGFLQHTPDQDETMSTMWLEMTQIQKD